MTASYRQICWVLGITFSMLWGTSALLTPELQGSTPKSESVHHPVDFLVQAQPGADLHALLRRHDLTEFRPVRN